MLLRGKVRSTERCGKKTVPCSPSSPQGNGLQWWPPPTLIA